MKGINFRNLIQLFENFRVDFNCTIHTSWTAARPRNMRFPFPRDIAVYVSKVMCQRKWKGNLFLYFRHTSLGYSAIEMKILFVGHKYGQHLKFELRLAHSRSLGSYMLSAHKLYIEIFRWKVCIFPFNSIFYQNRTHSRPLIHMHEKKFRLYSTLQLCISVLFSFNWVLETDESFLNGDWSVENRTCMCADFWKKCSTSVEITLMLSEAKHCREESIMPF